MNTPTYRYIDRQSALDSLIEEIRDYPRIALDTEADSLYHYFEKACLIQLSAGEKNYIIDPLADLDLGGFFQAVAGKEIIFHGADYDLRLLRAGYDFQPRGGIFDTMLAAQVLGYRKLGLAALADIFFGVTLSKGGQKFNWSKRPLPEDKLAYAAGDTRFLEELAGLLEEKLEQRGRTEWHRQLCRDLVESTRTDRPGKDPDKIWRIKGWKDCDRKELAYLRGFWQWREEEARRADRPPFKILGNSRLREVACWCAAHPKQPIASGPKLPRDCRDKRLEALRRIRKKLDGLKPDRWPPLRPKTKRRYPSFSEEEALRVKELRGAVAEIAHRMEIPPSVLASRAAVEDIVRAGARTAPEIREAAGITLFQARILEPEIRKIGNQ